MYSYVQPIAEHKRKFKKPEIVLFVARRKSSKENYEMKIVVDVSVDKNPKFI